MRPLFLLKYEKRDVSVNLSIYADTEDIAMEIAKRECPTISEATYSRLECWEEYDPVLGKSKITVKESGKQQLTQAIL